MIYIAIMSILLNLDGSTVLFRNPSGLSKISAGLNETVRIAWTVEPRDSTYLKSHLVFRKADKSCIIMSFDQEKAYNFSNAFQDEISSMGVTYVTLQIKSNLLEEVLISVENFYRESSEVVKVEVYDFLPIYIVHPPIIICGEVDISHDSLVNFECTIGSKPESQINIGFQKIPLKYDVDKQLIENSASYYKVSVKVSFKMSALYFGKKIYVSASTGSFDMIKELIIPIEAIPFNVQLYFDEQTVPMINLKPYTNSVRNIYLRCSASSHDKSISYTIYGPNKIKITNETHTIEKLSETKHVGLWYCVAKNKLGEVASSNIKVSLERGVPERPTILVQNLISKNNVFVVSSKVPYTVTCTAGSFPEVTMYYLQMINSGTERNIFNSKTGKFILNYNHGFTENIFLCKAENILGFSLPVVFSIQDTQNTGWSKTNTSFLQSSFITAICILTVFLLIMVLYIGVKLKRSPDARNLLWQLIKFKMCTTILTPLRSNNSTDPLSDFTERDPLFASCEQLSNTRNLKSDVELEYRFRPNLEVWDNQKYDEYEDE